MGSTFALTFVGGVMSGVAHRLEGLHQPAQADRGFGAMLSAECARTLASASNPVDLPA